MRKRSIRLWITCMLVSVIFLSACGDNNSSQHAAEVQVKYGKGTYGYDLSFIKEHVPVYLELKDQSGGAAIIIAPGFQGRVMTSTAGGDSGASFGWINYDLISSHKKRPQFNPVGGEERFWLGPEGGQFALFFKKGDSFNINNWQVPTEIDTVAFQLLSSNRSTAVFSHQAELSNYSGTDFHLQIIRIIRLLDKPSLQQMLHVVIPPDLPSVAYESDNQIKNTGTTQWKKEKGLVSIWLLGQMRPSEKTIVFLPFKPGPQAAQYITDDYFGKVPQDRLHVKDSIVFFRCDGMQRGKIGISPRIAGPMAASFDFERNLLTVISFTVEKDGFYVNSKWEMQKQPYKGDAVNSYNDGPLADGSQLGPFYEIESSSSAKELKPGESQVYKQLTCHFQGNYQSLRVLARQLLGVDLDDLKKW